ncbi:hypothetical protein AB0C96_04540 [Streptomyces sp. NPDC048506]|uniref:hypothetical protein n=1 Tax=Streptomyces sp. NPDC048506 TaxID=3155028 RepID=UPI00342D4712
MRPRHLHRILATTGLHSGLGNAKGLIAGLDRARKSSLIVGCGDFFEGTGHHRLGGGSAERRMLAGAYDVIAPGNHGWHHHVEPELHALTVCANVIDTAGKPLFRRLFLTTIGGRRVAVTAILGFPAGPANLPIPGRPLLSPRELDAPAGAFTFPADTTARREE